MIDRERVRLLHGPYRTPKLRPGDRTTCLLRDCEVVVTSISDVPIPWPRCRALGEGRGGGSGLWLRGRPRQSRAPRVRGGRDALVAC
jgi:hypothetical protein